ADRSGVCVRVGCSSGNTVIRVRLVVVYVHYTAAWIGCPLVASLVSVCYNRPTGNHPPSAVRGREDVTGRVDQRRANRHHDTVLARDRGSARRAPVHQVGWRQRAITARAVAPSAAAVPPLPRAVRRRRGALFPSA